MHEPLFKGFIKCLVLFFVGSECHELIIHFLPGPSTLRLLMSMAKGFSYVGSGLIGFVTTAKWLKLVVPKYVNWFKGTKLYKFFINGNK